MNTTIFADFIVNFDPNTQRHICHHTTKSVESSPIPPRLLFHDRAAFLRHCDCHGRIRVAFADSERIVRGVAETDVEQHAAEGSAPAEAVMDDVVILTRPILYSDVADVIRAIKAARKRG